MKSMAIRYAGPSMNPTFVSGDMMQVVACEENDIVPGDVIVFISSAKGRRRIVHRVIDVIPGDAVCTRGDNNPIPDTRPVPYAHIVGRVVSIKRGRQILPIAGGPQGLTRARPRWALRRIEAMAIRILGPVYHRFCRSGPCKKWIQGRLNHRVVAFKQASGIEFHLFVGRRFIGRKLPGSSQWQIKRPFRLFINESDLPD